MCRLKKRFVCSNMIVLLLSSVILTPSTRAEEPILGADEPTAESLDVRFARAHLKLAQFDLRRALKQLEQAPGALRPSAVDALKRHVMVDQEELEQALADDGSLHQIYVRSAKTASDLARIDVARKQQALARFPSEQAREDLKRAKLVASVAGLHFEMTKEKEQDASMSSMMYLQWQIEVLRSQVLHLQLDRDAVRQR